MKILYFVKTSDGAKWALEMVRELVLKGLNLTVVLPCEHGKMVGSWEKTGAKIIFLYSELPVKKIWKYPRVLFQVKRLVSLEKPDIVHCHFFSQVILLRKVLKDTKIPLIFQVPGPLHLESFFFRNWDLLSARSEDSWIASSQYIYNIYKKHNIAENRLGLSYYGNDLSHYNLDESNLREKIGLSPNDFVIGNLSYFYPPKKYLFQKVGIKGHEFLISLAKKLKKQPKIKMVLFGACLGPNQTYFNKLKKNEDFNLFFPGSLNPFDVSAAWSTLDICIHMPLSENCGGVLEPLLHSVPVITCNTGALEEVIINKKTGLIVSRNLEDVSTAIQWSLENPADMNKMMETGKKLIIHMFDVKRTATEVYYYYNNLNSFQAVEKFNSKDYLNEIK